MTRTLTDEDLDLIADRIAGERARMLDTAAVADLLAVSQDWVREHAAELGAVRLGSSPRGPLRFDRRSVIRAVENRRLQPAGRPHRRPGPARGARSRGRLELLPIPGEAA